MSKKERLDFPLLIFKGHEEYPTISGIGIEPLDLDLPESHLNPNKKSNWNNHHNCWVKKEFAKLAIFQTCRDLELNQFGMLVDQHDWLHANFEPPKMPTVKQAMDRCIAAYECGEKLRHGSLNNPKFVELTEDRIYKLHDEYNKISHTVSAPIFYSIT